MSNIFLSPLKDIFLGVKFFFTLYLVLLDVFLKPPAPPPPLSQTLCDLDDKILTINITVNLFDYTYQYHWFQHFLQILFRPFFLKLKYLTIFFTIDINVKITLFNMNFYSSTKDSPRSLLSIPRWTPAN